MMRIHISHVNVRTTNNVASGNGGKCNCSSGSRIFPGGGTPKVGVVTFFCRKLHENEKNWTLRRTESLIRSFLGECEVT